MASQCLLPSQELESMRSVLLDQTNSSYHHILCETVCSSSLTSTSRKSDSETLPHFLSLIKLVYGTLLSFLTLNPSWLLNAFSVYTHLLTFQTLWSLLWQIVSYLFAFRSLFTDGWRGGRHPGVWEENTYQLKSAGLEICRVRPQM